MSTAIAEAAPEALDKKLKDLKIVDGTTGEQSEENERPRRKFVITDEERRRQWEEEQKDKPVIESGVTGRVKWYSVLGHYGFISRDDAKKDVFVHQSAITKSHTIKYFLRTLADDEEVVFDVVEGKSGQEAANVTGPGGVEVKGSRFQRVLLRRFRSGLRSRKEQSEPKENSEESTEQSEGDVKKRSRRQRRSAKKPAAEKETKENETKEEDKEVKEKSRKKRGPRRRNRNRNRAQNGEKTEKSDGTESDASHQPGQRRRTHSEVDQTEERCGSALATGDANLGATKLDAQVPPVNGSQWFGA